MRQINVNPIAKTNPFDAAQSYCQKSPRLCIFNHSRTYAAAKSFLAGRIQIVSGSTLSQHYPIPDNYTPETFIETP